MSDTPENQTTEEGSKKNAGQEIRYWLDDIRNVHKLFWILVVVCVVLFVSDAFYHKHVVFSFENWFGFFGLFGFFLSFALVLTAKEIRKLLKRDEDFYDR